MTKPLCFVLMPFGKSPGPDGHMIDFDSVYRQLICPAIAEAGLEPLRADEETTGGDIHTATIERLVLSEYAIVDLTTGNANVLYGLGVRHAVRPAGTVLVFSQKSRLPFGADQFHALPYTVGPTGAPENIESATKLLTEQLRAAGNANDKGSPLFLLVEGVPDIQRLRTDVFRERVQYPARTKDRLAEARKQGKEAVRAIERELGNLNDQESAVLIDLLLSYRAVKAWEDMIDLVEKLPRPLRDTVMVQEQFAFALNRSGQSDRAEEVLQELLNRRGPSSETYGILGRVYKDRWESALHAGQTALANEILEKAIGAYLKGFEADWRDAFPGINAVTLMTLRDPPDPRRDKLIPIVAYAVERRIARGEPDYWDYATRLELAVLAGDEASAASALRDALAAVREIWEPETTARNLRLIREARERRGTAKPWMKQIEQSLLDHARK